MFWSTYRWHKLQRNIGLLQKFNVKMILTSWRSSLKQRSTETSTKRGNYVPSQWSEKSLCRQELSQVELKELGWHEWMCSSRSAQLFLSPQQHYTPTEWAENE